MENSNEDIGKMLPKVRSTRCNCCSNHCHLEITILPDGKRLISGNHCSRPLSGKNSGETYDYDSFEYMRTLYSRYMDSGKSKGRRGRIGLPMSLMMYEYLPLFHTLFTNLGYEVVVSPFTTDEMLQKEGDSFCLSARIMKAHVDYLLEEGVDKVFLPAITSVTRKENTWQNCPISSYLGTAMKSDERLLSLLLPVGRQKEMAMRLSEVLDLPRKDIKDALEEGFEEMKKFRKKLSKLGPSIVKKARKEDRKIVVVAGRSYYTDPQIFHSIDKMLLTLGVSVIGDHSIGKLVPTTLQNSLIQWVGHGRIHDSAVTVADNRDMGLVLINTQGCGLDAVTCRDIAQNLSEKGGKALILTLSESTPDEEIFSSLMEFVKTL